MTPREIDALVAEHVFGWQRWDTFHDKGQTRPVTMWFRPDYKYPIEAPQFSTDLLAAWQVVEKMNEAGWWITELRQKVVGYKWGVEFVKDGEWMNIDGHQLAGADTAQMAICLAALRAKGIEV